MADKLTKAFRFGFIPNPFFGYKKFYKLGINDYKLFLLLTIFIVLNSLNLHAQYSHLAEYFPLQVGNKYIYFGKKSNGFPHYNVTFYTKIASITDTSIINGKKYFKCNNFPGDINNYWVRFDTVTGSLYSSVPGSICNTSYSELLLDSFAVSPNTLIHGCYQFQTYEKRSGGIGLNSSFKINECIQFHIYTYFGGSGGSSRWTALKYLKTIGPFLWGTQGVSSGISAYDSLKLKGCVINGTVYGDTILTNLNLSANQIPETFSLLQNYPNPFNPVTNIKFDVPKSSYVTLRVYDLLGRELAVLVNENLKTGSYQYQWDGSAFASGVYFYKLETEDFSETKKMLMLK